MTTYYVSSINGNDNNAGTSANAALATLQDAANLVKPGDTVEVMNGTYTGPAGGAVLNITTSGTASAPITFEAAPGQTPVIDSSGTWIGIDIQASNIVVNGFTVVGDAANYTLSQALAGYSTGNADLDTNGIFIQPSSSVPLPNHITIENNTLYNITGGAIGTEGADYLQIVNNTVHNTSNWSAYGASAISVSTSQNLDQNPGPHISVSGNLVYDNAELVPPAGWSTITDGEGIILDTNPGYTGGVLVQNNTLYGNGGPGIESNQTDNATITGNTVYGNNTNNNNGADTNGIFIYQSNNDTVTNNSTAPSTTGTTAGSTGSGSSASGSSTSGGGTTVGTGTTTGSSGSTSSGGTGSAIGSSGSTSPSGTGSGTSSGSATSSDPTTPVSTGSSSGAGTTTGSSSSTSSSGAGSGTSSGSATSLDPTTPVSTGSSSSTTTSTAAPALTVQVNPGTSVALGLGMNVPNKDSVTVNISGLPRYETITDNLDHKTFRGSSINLTAAEVNSGLTLTSHYRGVGSPTATLTVTAHDSAGASIAPQTITVKDPPATTTSSSTSTPTTGSGTSTTTSVSGTSSGHHWAGHHHHHHNAVTASSSGTSTSTSGSSSGQSQTSHNNVAQWFSDHPDFAPAATTLSEAGASNSGATTNVATTTSNSGTGAGAQAYALLNQMMACESGRESHFAQIATAWSASSREQANLLTRPLH
jgi:parallel beta-helix repeat protein